MYGNNHATVFMEYLTKWPEVFPAKDQLAYTISRTLMERVIPRHGLHCMTILSLAKIVGHMLFARNRPTQANPFKLSLATMMILLCKVIRYTDAGVYDIITAMCKTVTEHFVS